MKPDFTGHKHETNLYWTQHRELWQYFSRTTQKYFETLAKKIEKHSNWEWKYWKKIREKEIEEKFEELLDKYYTDEKGRD